MGGVTQSKDDWTLVISRHRSQEVLREGSAHCSGTNRSGRFQFLTDLLQSCDLLDVLRVELLLVSDTSALTILRQTTQFFKL